MPHQSSPLAPFVAKLDRQAKLGPAARAAIIGLPHAVKHFDVGSYLFREGDRVTHCWAIRSGFACRHKIVGTGSRQILNVYLKGDGIDLDKALLPSFDHSVQAITPVEAVVIPLTAVSAMIGEDQEAARAVWVETLLDMAIQREWTANVGRRDARMRLAHLLCELGLRQEAAGINRRDDYVLPLTQEQLADATGLTAVHVNRVLGGLKTDGIILGRQRKIQVPDWERLARVGDFQSAYLGPAALPDRTSIASRLDVN